MGIILLVLLLALILGGLGFAIHVLGAVAALIAGPYAEELWRCATARKA